MEFVLNGVRRSLDASSVRSALRGETPDDVREHWVDVDGVRWPPKQALALATGVDASEFTSHRALRLLERLGFRTSPWGTDQPSAGTAAPAVVRPAGTWICHGSVAPSSPHAAAGLNRETRRPVEKSTSRPHRPRQPHPSETPHSRPARNPFRFVP